jgi:transposase
VTEDREEPELVARARQRAAELGFAISSAPGVGRLLAVRIIMATRKSS